MKDIKLAILTNSHLHVTYDKKNDDDYAWFHQAWSTRSQPYPRNCSPERILFFSSSRWGKKDVMNEYSNRCLLPLLSIQQSVSSSATVSFSFQRIVGFPRDAPRMSRDDSFSNPNKGQPFQLSHRCHQKFQRPVTSWVMRGGLTPDSTPLVKFYGFFYCWLRRWNSRITSWLRRCWIVASWVVQDIG